MKRLTTDGLAAATLFLGFVVADLSENRGLGAAVLVGGLAWCVLRERRRTGWWRLAVVTMVGVACFGLAHVLADRLGGYPAAGLASVILGVATHLVVVRPGARASADPTRARRPAA